MKALGEAFSATSLQNGKRKLSVEVFGASTKTVDSETPNCEQQAVQAKLARRKECGHVRSAFSI